MHASGVFLQLQVICCKTWNSGLVIKQGPSCRFPRSGWVIWGLPSLAHRGLGDDFLKICTRLKAGRQLESLADSIKLSNLAFKALGVEFLEVWGKAQRLGCFTECLKLQTNFSLVPARTGK